MSKVERPSLEGTVAVRGGRRLSFAEYGAPRGPAIVWMHGTPGARRQIPFEARLLAAERGLRIIGIDRPGIGSSTPHLYPDILDWTGDLALLLDALAVDTCRLIGLSGGIDSSLVAAVAADASLIYSGKSINANLSYMRGANGGSGVQPGASSDAFTASAGRSYGPDWVASLSATYTRTSGLLAPSALVGSPDLNALLPYAGGSGNTVFGGAQVSRRLGESLSAFASYNLQHQSIDSTLASQNAFSGFTHTFGIGITFSPRSTRLGQF